MTRNALLLCAGLIAATTFAGIPTASSRSANPIAAAPSSPPPAPRTNLCATDAQHPTPASAFAGRLQWTADSPSSPQTVPSAGPPPANFAAYQASVQAAFGAAPVFFRELLCGLNGIYITTSSQSWGFRNPGSLTRYVGLSTSLWSGNPPAAIGVDDYQNRVLARWPTTDPFPPSYQTATPNDGSTAILAALAHEYGHILWADILYSTPNTMPDSANFCQRALDYPWSNIAGRSNWTAFEEVNLNTKDIDDDMDDQPATGDPTKVDVHVQKMIDALGLGTFPGQRLAHRIIWRLLAPSRPFPSLLGAYSANEQFVETFMFYTLMNGSPRLTNAPLEVSPGFIRDIPGDLLGNTTTRKKRVRLLAVMACFKQRFGAPRP